jgi:hypothetical protein
MYTHTVRQGESVISLSKRYGILADKILDHPDNRQYQDRGRSRGILHPGDMVTIPDRETREEEVSTEQRHRFRCLNQLAWLKIRFLRGDRPLANEPYTLRVGDNDSSGNLDQDGWLRRRVPVDARDAVVLLGEGFSQRTVDLRIGNLNPAQETSGIGQRLHNLGFLQSNGDLESDRIYAEGIRMFQAKYGLEETGELNEDTRNRIVEVYGC